MYMEYHIRHITHAIDTQYNFHASFSYAFLNLVILPTATRGLHWRQLNNKPAHRRFSGQAMPSI